MFPYAVSVYVNLVLASALYAVALDSLKNAYMPNYTWIATGIGVLIVLAAPVAIQLVYPQDGWTVLKLTLFAFIVSAVPVGIWRTCRAWIERAMIRLHKQGR